MDDQEHARLALFLDRRYSKLGSIAALPDVDQADILLSMMTEPRFDMARRIIERNGRLSA
jgi:hypothetical protein